MGSNAGSTKRFDNEKALQEEVIKQIVELGNVLGIKIEVKNQNVDCCGFKADIIGEEVISGWDIVIENQLNRTDHKHLGQLITYSADRYAKDKKPLISIWIVEEVHEAHEKAITWLNEITDDEKNFFLVQFKSHKVENNGYIDDLCVIIKPNYWPTKKYKDFYADNSQIGKLREVFWKRFENQLNDPTIQKKLALPPGRTDTDTGKYKNNYYRLPFMSNRGIDIFLRTGDNGFPPNTIICEIYIANNIELFRNLRSQLVDINRELQNVNVEDFTRSNEDQARRFIAQRGFDINDVNNWEEAFQWYINTPSELQRVFQGRIQNILNPVNGN
jgi:hypothetical protein